MGYEVAVMNSTSTTGNMKFIPQTRSDRLVKSVDPAIAKKMEEAFRKKVFDKYRGCSSDITRINKHLNSKYGAYYTNSSSFDGNVFDVKDGIVTWTKTAFSNYVVPSAVRSKVATTLTNFVLLHGKNVRNSERVIFPAVSFKADVEIYGIDGKNSQFEPQIAVVRMTSYSQHQGSQAGLGGDDQPIIIISLSKNADEDVHRVYGFLSRIGYIQVYPSLCESVRRPRGFSKLQQVQAVLNETTDKLKQTEKNLENAFTAINYREEELSKKIEQIDSIRSDLGSERIAKSDLNKEISGIKTMVEQAIQALEGAGFGNKGDAIKAALSKLKPLTGS